MNIMCVTGKRVSCSGSFPLLSYVSLGFLGSYFNYKVLSCNEIGIDLVIFSSGGHLFDAE